MKKDMEKDSKKIREPYKPEETPKPPQIIDPDAREERKNPVKDEPENRQEKKPGEKDEKQHLLADDADIHDETTI